MTFFGQVVRPAGQPVAFVPPPEQWSLHLSQAALLASVPEGKRCSLMVKQQAAGERPAVTCLCTLTAGRLDSVPLDLFFGEYVEFYVEGDYDVHISGYYSPSAMDGEDDEEDDEDDYQITAQDIAGIEDDEDMSDASDDDDDDDDDDDEDEDSGDEEDESDEEEEDEEEDLLPGRRKPRVVIEEITDDEPKEAAKGSKVQTPAKQQEERAAAKRPSEPSSSSKEQPPAKKQDVKQDQQQKGVATPSKQQQQQQQALAAKQQQQQQQQQQQRQLQGASPAAQLVGNSGKKQNVRRFENGMEIADVEMGRPDGKLAQAGKRVVVSYVGRLKANGKVFDSNKKFAFRLGVGEVIKGWDVGVQGMRVGDKRRLVIPPQMAYGTGGVRGAIPPNAALEFDVQLLDVK